MDISISSISVFIPVYRDENTIKELVTNTAECLEQITRAWQILVIDDCSPDKSGEIAEELAKQDERLKVVRLPQNLGVGGAMKIGYELATKEFVFYTDGDAQYDIKEIKRFLPYVDSADAIVGYRIKRADSSIRKVTAFIFRMLNLFLFKLNLKDVDCSFKLIRRSILKDINLKSNSGFVDAELMIRIIRKGYRVKEIGVTHYPRRFGKSQCFRFKVIYDMVKDIIQMRLGLLDEANR